MAQVNSLRAREQSGPMHFIFHTAFCCSTLMARALDVKGVSESLKEPGVLLSFARHWASPRQTPGALEALATTLNLLSRAEGRDETRIVKASNAANHLLPEILHLRPESKILIMYSSLGGFLEAVARRDLGGRQFARQIFRGFADSIPLDITFSAEEQLLQTDLQIAAHAWLMQIAFFNAMIRHYGAERIRTLESDAFLDSKLDALSRVGEFFALRGADDRWELIAEGPVFKVHSKERGLAFDTMAHRRQMAEARAAAAREISHAEDWARHLAAQASAPFHLGNTLLQPNLMDCS